MYKLRWYQYLLIIVILILLLVQGGLLSSKPEEIAIEKPDISLLQYQPIPVKIASESAQLVSEEQLLNSLSAKSIVIIDIKSGAILLEKEAHTATYPASTTKMMTAIVAKTSYPQDEVITVTKEAFTTGNIMGLRLGEKMTVKNLLAGLLINSGNDAAFALANNHPLGYQGFVDQMNYKAQQLHLDNTSFNNPSGLDQKNHQSTAFDLATLAKEVIKDDYFKELVATRSARVSNVDETITHQLYNTNSLLGNVEGIKGVKTGTTDLAGEVLISLVERNNHQVLIVVMGSKGRYVDTKAIINWIFENYKWLEAD